MTRSAVSSEFLRRRVQGGKKSLSVDLVDIYIRRTCCKIEFQDQIFFLYYILLVVEVKLFQGPIGRNLIVLLKRQKSRYRRVLTATL